MIHTLLRGRALVILLLLAVALTGCDKHAKAKKEVQSHWEAYRAAAEKGEGLAAANMLSKSTHDHYTRLVKLAMDAPAAECWKLKPTEMAEVAGMRVNYARKDLRAINGIGYVAMAIKDGQWETYDADWRLRDIKIGEGGDSATAVICNPKAEAEYKARKVMGSMSRRGRRLMGLEAPPAYPASFVKVGDAWKYDETATLLANDQEIVDQAKFERMSVRDYVTVLATEEYDTKEALKIWEPMKK